MVYRARHVKATPRQIRALKWLALLVVVVVLVALSAAFTEIAIHGWAHFATRPAGVGGSPQETP